MQFIKDHLAARKAKARFERFERLVGEYMVQGYSYENARYMAARHMQVEPK